MFMFDVFCFSAELAAQLHADELQRIEIESRGDLPTRPPNSLEEYERAAAVDHQERNRQCTLL